MTKEEKLDTLLSSKDKNGNTLIYDLGHCFDLADLGTGGGGALRGTVRWHAREDGASMTRRVALVSGHFFPSNLVGAQRARLWAQYLPEFGWEPLVVAGDPEQYASRTASLIRAFKAGARLAK